MSATSGNHSGASERAGRPPCYYRGCTQAGTTKEHIPPRAFFPTNLRNQLLTVKSCPKHNNDKSGDDTYVLAHICLNASPNVEARSVFLERVKPQLAFNGDALYLFDTTCDASVAGPFDLGTGPLLEGALMPAWDAPRRQLLVLMTLSSRLARAR